MHVSFYARKVKSVTGRRANHARTSPWQTTLSPLYLRRLSRFTTKELEFTPPLFACTYFLATFCIGAFTIKAFQKYIPIYLFCKYSCFIILFGMLSSTEAHVVKYSHPGPPICSRTNFLAPVARSWSRKINVDFWSSAWAPGAAVGFWSHLIV